MSDDHQLAAGHVEPVIVHNAGDAVVVADRDGLIRFWNPAAERMFGYEAKVALGAPLDLIIPEKLRPAHWTGYRTVMQTGTTRYGSSTLSVPAIRSDGTRISVSFTVALLQAPDGEVAGIAAIMRDVTSEWEEKRAMRARISELEREVAGNKPRE